MLTKIIESDPPILPENSTFSNYFREFIKLCLQKDVEKRPKYKYLKVRRSPVWRGQFGTNVLLQLIGND